MPVSDTTLLNEQTILRNELQELKRCQIQYFLLSIAATGVLFGFKEDLSELVENGSTLYLVPLIIVLPCWLTFFDKATTITRLTGYVMVFIEEQLKNKTYHYFGYENALAEFREKEKQYIRELEIKIDIWEAIRNPTRNQYWKICWLTFLFLSLACYLYPLIRNGQLIGPNTNLYLFSLVTLICLVCIFFAGRIIQRLLTGIHSYRLVKQIWEKVFSGLIQKNQEAIVKDMD